MSNSTWILITKNKNNFVSLSENWYFSEIVPSLDEIQYQIIAIDKEFPLSASVFSELQKKITASKLETTVFLVENSLELEREMQNHTESIEWSRQPHLLHQMLLERKEELSNLEQVLTQKIEKKNKSLQENRKKLFWISQKQNLLKNCLIALQEAESIPRIEEQFLRFLSSPFELSWIKILTQDEADPFCLDLEERIPSTYLRIPLFGGMTELGAIVFVKIAKLDFSKEQTEFLRQISEAVSMAVIRIRHLENTLQLQHQWEATFHAIPSPVLLINAEYEIIQSNMIKEQKEKRKCYEELFKRQAPCNGCHRGKKFLLEENTHAYEVMSQKFSSEKAGEEVFVNTYIDITEKNRIQKKILESSKLAEIGLIGGSIAHEINNPLGGLLSYIQLIRMDLQSDDPRRQDILEMEIATQRCVQIVKNLLEASRDSSPV